MKCCCSVPWHCDACHICVPRGLENLYWDLYYSLLGLNSNFIFTPMTVMNDGQVFIR